MEDKKPIGFAINNFRIEQFATISGFDGSHEDYKLSVQIGFSADAENQLIGNSMEVKFLSEDDKPFVIAAVAGSFEIDPNTWDNLLNDDKSAYTIPLHLARHLSVITTGTMRGVLLAKILNTAPEYAAFVLPTLNLTELIEEDVSLPLVELEEEWICQKNNDISVKLEGEKKQRFSSPSTLGTI